MGLRFMASTREKVAENFISQTLADEIFPYLTFRHFFIHAYGFMLDDEPILKLAAKIQTVHARFVAEVETALQRIENIN